MSSIYLIDNKISPWYNTILKPSMTEQIENKDIIDKTIINTNIINEYNSDNLEDIENKSNDILNEQSQPSKILKYFNKLQKHKKTILFISIILLILLVSIILYLYVF